MEIEYTKEQIQNAKFLVYLTLNENGFNEKRVNIVKTTDKKFYLDDTIYHKGSYKNQLFYTDTSFAMKDYLGGVSGVGRYKVAHSVLILEKDVEKLKSIMREIALKQIDNVIESLNKQREAVKMT